MNRSTYNSIADQERRAVAARNGVHLDGVRTELHVPSSRDAVRRSDQRSVQRRAFPRRTSLQSRRELLRAEESSPWTRI